MDRLLGGRARDGYVVKGQEIKLWSCIHLAYGTIAYVADTQYFVHHGKQYRTCPLQSVMDSDACSRF